MANIPYVAVISFLFLCVSGFRVPPISDNPDLTINEELNMVEPKLDFWHILVRPKAKTTFKNILKLLNNLDSKNKYSVEDESTPSISQLPVQFTIDIPMVKKEDYNENSVSKKDYQYIVQEDINPGIVSEEIGEKESLSEEHHSRIAMASISVESNEKSSEEIANTKKIEDSQNSDSSKESSSQESNESKVGNGKKAEERKQPEAPTYKAQLPKSLHNLNIGRPKFQHSIRDGWFY